MDYKIVLYEEKYRDDMIFCYLQSQDVMGKPLHLREDLLRINEAYFAKGDAFWLALNGAGRVAGMIGVHKVSENDMWLHRLRVGPGCKRRGLGSALLAAAEDFAREKGIRRLHTRFSDDNQEAGGFYPAKGFAEAERSEGLRHMVKELA